SRAPGSWITTLSDNRVFTSRRFRRRQHRCSWQRFFLGYNSSDVYTSCIDRMTTQLRQVSLYGRRYSGGLSVKFIHLCHYIDDLDRVADLRPAHRQYMDLLDSQHKLWAAGPFADGKGALFIYEAQD